MPVIINEFEMVVEPPSQNQTPNTPPSPPPMTPKDMERLIEHFKQRRSRLHAD